MFEKKIDWKGYTIIIILGNIWLYATFCSIILLINPSSDILEEATSEWERIIIAIIIMLGATIIIIPSLLGLIKQIIKYRKVALFIDQDGIHNTFIFRCIIGVIPTPFFISLKFIPWSAVIDIDQTNLKNMQLLIHVDDEKVETNSNRKPLFSIGQFDFCKSYTSKFTSYEMNIILSYLEKQNIVPNCVVDSINRKNV